MADLGCSICQETFSASAVCVATKCGHVFHKTCVSQWILTSKTCPSCRAVCTMSALIRIYFTTSLADLSMRDLDSVTNKLLSAQEQVAKLKTDNESLKEKLNKMVDKHKDMKNMVSTLDDMNKRKDHLIKMQSSQLKDYSAQKARADSMAHSTQELTAKVAQMTRIEAMMNSSAAAVEQMIASETCFKTLAILVVNLKRELATTQAKKSEIYSSNCCLNNKLKHQNQAIESLQDKYKSLESEFLTIQSQLRSRLKDANELKRTSTNGLPVTGDYQAASSPRVVAEKAEEKTDSPYLRLASSSVGLAPLMNSKKIHLNPTGLKVKPEFQKLSIFAKKTTAPVPLTAHPFNRVEKENVQITHQCGHAAAPPVARSDRFKIENRLKSGAIKRPTPYAPK